MVVSQAKPVQQTRRSVPTVGELRYIPTAGVVVRVIRYADECAVIEHLPSGHRVMLKATTELMDAAVAHINGFRARWCTGALSLAPGAEQETLEAIRLDEEANGRDRIRLRAIDDYLSPVPDSDEARERLRNALTGSDAWVKVGRGAELGYVPAGTGADWRERWRRDQIRFPRAMDQQDEGLSIRALRGELSGWGRADLGRVAACGWLPGGLRAEATRLLAEMWRSGSARQEFRLVLDDAMLRMVDELAEPLSSEGWRDLLTSSVLSPTVRAAALKRWRAHTGEVAIATLIAGPPRVDDTLVAVELFRLAESADDLVATLANVLRLSPPDDDEGKDATRRLLERGKSLGERLLPITIAAARRALSSGGAARTVEPWLRHLSDGMRPSLLEVCGALATMEVLGQTSTELAALAADRVTVENGLTRWVQAELPDDIQDDPDIVSLVASAGAGKVLGHCEARVRSRDHRKLGEWVVALSAEVERLHREVAHLSSLVDDKVNAERVLGRVAAEATRSARQELRDSALAEVEGARQREREKIARMVGESVTAVERILEAGGPPTLSNLSRRLRELATDLGLRVVGLVGEVVIVDPATQETSAQAGSRGEIRRVGVVDLDGRLVMRPAVVPRGDA